MGVTPHQKGLGGWLLRLGDPERGQQRRDLQGRPCGPGGGAMQPGGRGSQPSLDRAAAEWADRVDRAAWPWWRRLLGRRPR